MHPSERNTCDSAKVLNFTRMERIDPRTETKLAERNDALSIKIVCILKDLLQSWRLEKRRARSGPSI